ncbi:MAG: response regulator [Rhodocyclaceae bacterium]
MKTLDLTGMTILVVDEAPENLLVFGLPPVDKSMIDQLLIVDDDPGVLSSLTRTLSFHSRSDDLFTKIRSEVFHRHGPILREGSINVQTTSSPCQAIKMAASTEFSCLIADFKMPEMNGIDLLQNFSALQPDYQRILLSGQINENDLILAVDSAHIFAFIDKPWSDYELKACLALALLRRRILRENLQLAEMVRKSEHFADS